MHPFRVDWRKFATAAGLALLAVSSLRAQDVIVGPPTAFPGQTFDQPLTLKSKLTPEFPREMKPSGEIGYAIVMLYVDDKGKNRSRWVNGTVHPYRNAVDEELGRLRVQPAERSGKPVDSRVWFSVIFNPATAAGNLPDATPRLLEVSPVFHPDKKAEKEVVVPVTLTVNDQGRAEKITAEPAFAALQAVVEKAVSGWKFSPARQGGQPVAAELKLSVLVQLPPVMNTPKSTPPSVISQSAPEYPRIMYSSGLRGQVNVEFVVSPEGKVVEAKVLESNNPGFNDAALDAVRRWKFKPARIDDKPVATKLRQQIIFQMDRQGGGYDAFGIEKAKKPKGTPPGNFEPDVSPKPKGVVLPVYPYELLRSRTKGSAEVRMIINERGVVVQTEVLKSTQPEFGQALAAALQAYTFEPALKQGKPIPSALKMEQEFDPADADRDERALLADETRHPEEIFSPKSVAELPKPIARPAPAFPPEKAGTSGRAVIEFLIDTDGRARLPRIVSATDPSFGYAAVQAIAAWQFEKPLVQGKATVMRVRMPIEFAPAGK